MTMTWEEHLIMIDADYDIVSHEHCCSGLWGRSPKT